MPPFSFTLLRTATGFAGKEPHKDTSETAMRCCRRTLREFPRLLRGNLRPILCCCARLCERKRMPARRSPGANEMSRSASASNYSHNKIGCRKQNTVHTMLMISAQAVRKVSRCASICNCFHNIDRKEQSIELTRSRLSGSGVRLNISHATSASYFEAQRIHPVLSSGGETGRRATPIAFVAAAFRPSRHKA